MTQKDNINPNSAFGLRNGPKLCWKALGTLGHDQISAISDFLLWNIYAQNNDICDMLINLCNDTIQTVYMSFMVILVHESTNINNL